MATSSSGEIRVAIVTNIPAPYRLPVYEILAADPQIKPKVFFCSGREPDRKWDLRKASFEQLHLRERFVSYRGRFIHFNPDVWEELNKFRPEVVITTGFNPTHLLAFAYALWKGARHIAMTDGTFDSEMTLSPFHRWVRRHVFNKTRSFIGASDGSLALYRSYDINESRLFKSHLCANNEAFFNAPKVEKQYDFIFCGRFVAVKSPMFALDLARQVAIRLGRKVSIVFVGSGELETEMRSLAATMSDKVEAVFPGFARQDELPQLYGAARIFLFPTQWDPWGVVANEACAAGLPGIVTPVAGASGELIRNGENGYVLPLDLDLWVDAATNLLTDHALYTKFSHKSLELVSEYTYENAALGIRNAVLAAVGRKSRPRVVIVQRRMTHYRVPLFELLRNKLNQSGVDLVVVYGDPTRSEQTKKDSGFLEWGIYQPCHYWLNGVLCWQNLSDLTRDIDLIIVTQENKLIYNLLLLFGKRNFRLAFWGHGANLQSKNPNGLLEHWKAWTSSHVDWWFAYSSLTVRLVGQHGFSTQRITNLENAIDTKTLRDNVDEVKAEDITALRGRLGIENGPVGLYLGSLYQEKRIDFLLKAAQKIVAEKPDFHLLVIGEGPLKHKMVKAAARYPWLRYIGGVVGRDKAIYLSMADVFLNPGMVGLTILDAFAAGEVFVTTNNAKHSPEIDYLVDGENGRMTANNIDAFVAEVVNLLNNPEILARISREAKLASKHYTIENMAENFHNGILQALAVPRVFRS